MLAIILAKEIFSTNVNIFSHGYSDTFGCNSFLILVLRLISGVLHKVVVDALLHSPLLPRLQSVQIVQQLLSIILFGLQVVNGTETISEAQGAMLVLDLNDEAHVVLLEELLLEARLRVVDMHTVSLKL